MKTNFIDSSDFHYEPVATCQKLTLTLSKWISLSTVGKPFLRKTVWNVFWKSVGNKPSSYFGKERHQLYNSNLSHSIVDMYDSSLGYEKFYFYTDYRPLLKIPKIFWQKQHSW